MLGACRGVSRDSTQPVCGMWRGGYVVLPVFASPGEFSGQGDVICDVILCMTQECPSSQTSYGSNGKERKRRRGRGQELPAVTRQWAGCTLKRWSRELSENCLLQLAGFPKEDVLGKNPLLSMFPSWKGVGGVCQDLLRCRQARPGTRSGGLVSPQPRGAAQSHCPQMTQPPWAFHWGSTLSARRGLGTGLG